MSFAVVVRLETLDPSLVSAVADVLASLEFFVPKVRDGLGSLRGHGVLDLRLPIAMNVHVLGAVRVQVNDNPDLLGHGEVPLSLEQ